MIRAFIITVLLAISVHAQGPPALEELRSNYNKAIEKQMVQLTSVYMKSLEAMQEQYTKDGNLDAALAVRAEIAKMNKEVFLDMQAQQSSLQHNEVVGEWKSQVNTKKNRYSTTILILQEDGRVVQKEGAAKGRWIVENRELKITWEKGNFLSFKFQGLRVPKELEGASSAGKKAKLNKL